ncbi:5-formyltetrahydrofolate cyclo-ligase family protein [Pseudooceanicola batsensis HTCC2597]|uniref:5-formyltetrahydrofolate cyclo-ligase n=1 Tax=Pseudooceanicola batsensis (strain ATCC BAA-863 / DSM 15984 / KCTC 12145 / HTCC2597) TaxID=252305 RepID=A3TVC2_PSEBH|nr:5-formyltetrahydrofolate cyclo-ligase [Pseudooceanicola batsensis]EAQ04468.1 5-formyltetrahydrofolate cyclo-ligase family protein [Pseudooceanicola batsensis HTCC2597]
MSIEAEKAAARLAAFARRKAAHALGGGRASGVLSEVLAGYRGAPVSGYLPIRTEIDPLPAMSEAAAHGPVGVPIIVQKDAPLLFAEWEPEAELVEGPFGARIPSVQRPMVPQIVIVPLVAFDRAGGRLGYGGGFYDRTLERLRAEGPVMALGFAYAAQETDALPIEPTDQPLDMIVTEKGVIEFGG